MVCEKCGNEVDSGAKFCPKCGAKLEKAEAPVKEKAKSRTGKKKIVIIGAVGIAVLLSFVIYTVLLKKNYGLIYDYHSDGTASVHLDARDQYTQDVEIPSTVKKGSKIYTVTRIENYAFSDCKSLTSITLPESVTSIGNYAFTDCDSLTSIMLSEGLTSIGDEAFSNCKSLTSVTLPESLTSIGDHAFSGCDSLTSITLPEGLSSIGVRAFENCDSLTSITLPESLTSIGGSAFRNCYNLTVIVPESVTGISDSAFDDRCKVIYQGDVRPGTAAGEGYSRSDFVSDSAYKAYLDFGDLSGLKKK